MTVRKNMITDCPDPREVADFHFLQLRTISVAQQNEAVPAKSVNILASASKYGLLFIGIEGGLKVIRLEDVLTLDEDKENRSIQRDYPFTLVPIGTPCVLAVNSSQTTLAVCIRSASGILLNLYSISAFPDSGAAWQPFCSNTLPTEVQDFSWNPAVEGVFAFCLNDGSLHIYEMAGKSLKALASHPAANAISICWSPKGKQLVVGKQNGFFSQYKPTLQEVKSIPPPALEEGPITVTSICWISTTVFAVVYVANDAPNLFIVSTPKDSAVVYTNFNDVCLGNCSSSNQKYFLHLEPSWGTLVCASLDSIEVSVLGDMPNWVQWDLKEDGKALLPGKDGATHAIGMAVMYSAQKPIIISESECYPPMPVMFLLTNNGLLVSFHMINTKSDVASLVSAPLPVEIKKSSSARGFSAPGAPQAIQEQLPPSSSQLAMPPTFAAEKVTVANQTPISQVTKPENNTFPASSGMMKNSAFSLSDPVKDSSNNSFGSGVVMNSLNKPEGTLFSPVQKTQEKSPMNTGALFTAVEKPREVQSSTDDSYMKAIISEIESFTKELQDLKLMQNSAPTIDSEEDMASLKIFALNLHNFQNDIHETMQSLSNDIYTLKNMLLESFVMVEEACSREKRKNDHSYITMLKERALDPITAKRMQKMNQHYQYLRTQLQEVSDRLDQDRVSLISNKKNTSNSVVSSSEAIYKTIVNNQKIIHTLKKKVQGLQKKAEERKLKNTTKSGTWGKYHKRSTQEDLSKLADEFLEVKISVKEEGEPAVTRKLSTESQTFLKAFLKESSIVTVRPTAVYSPSQSRLLSNALQSEEFSAADKEKDNSFKKVTSLPSPETRVSAAVSPASKSLALESVPKMTPSPKQVSASECTQPVYEPVTPPDTVPPINKTFTAFSTMITPLSLKDKGPKSLDTLPSFSPVTAVSSSPAIIMQKDSVNQSYSAVASSSVESSKSFPSISFASPGTKLPNFSQSSFQMMPPPASSSSAISSKSFFFTPPSAQTSSECIVSKPAISNNSISTSQEGKGISAVTSQSFPEFKSSFTPEKSQVTFQEKPLVTSSCIATPTVPFSQDVSFNFSIAQLSTSSSTTPTIKNSTQFDSPQTTPFFQKLPLNVESPRSPEKSESPATPRSPSDVNINFSLNLEDKSPTESKLPDRQEPNITVQPPVSSGRLTFTLSSQSQTSSDITKNDALTTATSQATATSIGDSKQSESSSTLVSKPSVLFSSLTLGNSPSPQPVSTVSVIVVSSNPSVTSTATFGSPLTDLTVSKSSDAPTVLVVSSEAVPTASTTMNLFGQTVSVCSPTSSESALDATKKTESSPFGAKSPLFGGKPPSSETSFFQTPAAVTTDVPAFGQTTPVTQAPPAFGQTTPVTQAPPAFGQTTPVTQAPPAFGQTTPVTQAPPAFGQSSTFPAASGDGFFSQTPSFGASTTAAATVASTDLNNQASTFSFGKQPAFGQTTGSFGLAKSFFNQTTAPNTQSGTASSFSFGQSQNSSLTFGQGSFFGGLGGKTNEENAPKSVFGMSTPVKPADSGNLFRSSGTSTFGASTGTFGGTGAFSGGGGSVAQSGFGAFQQSPVQQQQPAGPAFGAAPAFGSSPTFGGAPAFGSAPTFGSPGNSLSSIFGQQQQVSSNFSSFANASSPTFGSLASQTPNFGSPPLGGGGGGGGGFGGSTGGFGALSFGNQSSSFGSPGSPPSNSSAFTQWRN